MPLHKKAKKRVANTARGGPKQSAEEPTTATPRPKKNKKARAGNAKKGRTPESEGDDETPAPAPKTVPKRVKLHVNAEVVAEPVAKPTKAKGSTKSKMSDEEVVTAVESALAIYNIGSVRGIFSPLIRSSCLLLPFS